MKDIGQFFDKFRNKALGQIALYDSVLKIIKKHTNISLEVKDLSISGGKIRVKSSSAAKNEIYIKKEAIIKDISKEIVGLRLDISN